MLRDHELELRVILLNVNDSNVDPKLLKLFETSNEKISRKNRPSFFMIAGGKVIKLSPDHFSNKFESSFLKVLNNEIGKSREI